MFPKPPRSKGIMDSSASAARCDDENAVIGSRQQACFYSHSYRRIDCDRTLAFISPTDNTHFIVSTVLAGEASKAFAGSRVLLYSLRYFCCRWKGTSSCGDRRAPRGTEPNRKHVVFVTMGSLSILKFLNFHLEMRRNE